ncbi:hypothetical protein ACEXAJ_07185 [Fusobacterium necrophorum subsp. funduliforme]
MQSNHRIKNQANYIYFLTSMLFFYFQLNMVIQNYFQTPNNIVHLVIRMFFFKLGEFFHEIIEIKYGRFSIIISFLVSILIIKYDNPILYFLFSFTLMKIRNTVSEQSSKKIKVLGRALGFILAPFSNLVVYIIFLCFLYLGIFFYVENIKFRFIRINCVRNRKEIGYYALMTLHHIHYFIYAYSVPILFIKRTIIPIYCIGIIFYCGWAAYNAYEAIITPSWKWFITGHILAMLSLFMMFYFDNFYIELLGWFLTGLGGGTIYMLHNLVKTQNEFTKQDLLIAEGVGHVVGIGLWGVIILYYSINYTFLAGAIVAVLVSILSYILNLKEE